MKKIIAWLLVVIICLTAVSCVEQSSSNGSDTQFNESFTSSDIISDEHTDVNSDKLCDTCGISVVTTFDFYAINDLHGKFTNSETTVGVEGLTTYLKTVSAFDDNPILTILDEPDEEGEQE